MSKNVITIVRSMIKDSHLDEANDLANKFDGKPYAVSVERDNKNSFVDIVLTEDVIEDYNGSILSVGTIDKMRDALGQGFSDRMDAIYEDIQIVTTVYGDGQPCPIEWDYGQ